MPAIFDNSDLAFAYPENWQLDQTTDASSNPAITVNSPNTGFWSLSSFPLETDPLQLVEETIDALRIEYPEMDVEMVLEAIEGHSIERRDMYFVLLDFVVRSTVQVFNFRDRVYLLICQAEDSEFEAIGPVFQAMTTSLLRGDARLVANN